MSNNETIKDGHVVAMDYTLFVDDEIIDSSEDQEPLEFIQGMGNIIPGLERELYGMTTGDTKQVKVAAVDAYGEFSDEAFMDIPRDQFPEDIPLEEGTELQVRDEDGKVAMARITRVADESVRLDFNHPLAGKELHFDVTIVSLRDATPEELDHGHVHNDHHHH